MSMFLIFTILVVPFIAAALLSWAVQRGQPVRTYLEGVAEESDWYRAAHDGEEARNRFEHAPTWPGSGVTGERR